MRILGIDPGNQFSAYTLWNTETNVLEDFSEMTCTNNGNGSKKFVATPNDEMFDVIKNSVKTGVDFIAIEIIEFMGMEVGRSVIDTAFWYGRFFQYAVMIGYPAENIILCPRISVKKMITGSRGANDSMVVNFLIQEFGGHKKAIGGYRCNKCKGKGTYKKNPCPECSGSPFTEKGIFYPISKRKSDDTWQAFASAFYAKTLTDINLR